MAKIKPGNHWSQVTPKKKPAPAPKGKLSPATAAKIRATANRILGSGI